MSIIEIIKKRRSIRKFQNLPVEKEKIEKLIEAANWAPSACNIQGWKFIVVNDDEIKKQIVNNGGSVLISQAPVGILVIYDKQSKNTEYQDHLQSAAAAIQNLHLAATELGLGTSWICHLPLKKIVREIFKIPDYFEPVAYIILGYPAKPAIIVPRKYELNKIMAYNQFSVLWPVDKVNPLILVIKKILIKIYYLLPKIVKVKINKFIDSNFVKKFEN